MDWIQILAIFLAITQCFPLIQNLCDRDKSRAFGNFIGILLSLPIYGRVWMWW